VCINIVEMIVGRLAVVSLTFCHYCQVIQLLKFHTNPKKNRWIVAKVRIPMIDAMMAKIAVISLNRHARARSPTKGLRKHDFIRPMIDPLIEQSVCCTKLTATAYHRSIDQHTYMPNLFFFYCESSSGCCQSSSSVYE
jgi:hypothetical protein